MLSFNELKKNLKKDFSGLKKIKIAILADSASQFLNVALKGYGFETGINFEIYEAEYNQIDFQVFDSGSELYHNDPEFIFINRSSEHLLRDFYKKDAAAQAGFAQDVFDLTREYYNLLTSRLKAKIIINMYPEINDGVFGNYANKTQYSFIYQLRKLNLLLMEYAQDARSLFICDLAAQQATLGYNFTFDPKVYINADMVYSIDFLPVIAKNITDIILSISGSFKKCLVLDLDNTTWGGVIGDDGMEGIQLGYFGLGKAYTELQLWARQLKQRGIILAVCSKNTEEIALEPFQSHPDMILRVDDIAVFAANWETKVDNLRHIQSILNIGFDSMVFVDDNPFEREMVKSAIPDIRVPDLPEEPAEYLPYLRSLNLFETASFTDEDIDRTRQYREEAQRNIMQRTFTSEADFLQSLGMVSEVKPFDKFTIPRVAQLTQRSNQFNLRTVRYTEEDIAELAGNPGYFTMSFTLEDKFGSHGLIAIVILKKDGPTLFIDSWIMSCRVLKRGMEEFTLNAIMELARAEGFENVAGEYIPTKKNGIVKDHYDRLGFQFENIWVMNANKYEKRNTFVTRKTDIWTSIQS